MNRRIVGILDETEKLGLLIAWRVTGWVTGDGEPQNVLEPKFAIVHVILHAECNNALYSLAAQPLPARVVMSPEPENGPNFRYLQLTYDLLPTSATVRVLRHLGMIAKRPDRDGR